MVADPWPLGRSGAEPTALCRSGADLHRRGRSGGPIWRADLKCARAPDVWSMPQWGRGKSHPRARSLPSHRTPPSEPRPRRRAHSKRQTTDRGDRKVASSLAAPLWRRWGAAGRAPPAPVSPRTQYYLQLRAHGAAVEVHTHTHYIGDPGLVCGPARVELGPTRLGAELGGRFKAELGGRTRGRTRGPNSGADLWTHTHTHTHLSA